MRSSRHWLLAVVLTALVLVSATYATTSSANDNAGPGVVETVYSDSPVIGGDEDTTWCHLLRQMVAEQVRGCGRPHKWLVFIIDFYSRLIRQQRPLVQPLRL
jgi:hypothetical protein